jgi:hypothetical protein
MKENKYTILYRVFVRTFVMLFYYGSGTVIIYGSDFLTVTVLVPQGKKLRFRFLNAGLRNV